MPPPTPDERLADTLDRATIEILRRGLHRGNSADMTQNSFQCAVDCIGALRSARTGDPFSHVEVRDLVGVLEDQLRLEGRVVNLIQWNDEKARDANMVAALFRRTAERLRQEASY